MSASGIELEFLREWTGWFCHKLPDRSAHCDGEAFPVCFRCAGLQLGLMAVYVRFFFCRDWNGRFPAVRVVIQCAVMMLPLMADGLGNALGFWSSPGWVRGLTGLGAGLSLPFLLAPLAQPLDGATDPSKQPALKSPWQIFWPALGGIAAIVLLARGCSPVVFRGLAVAAAIGWMLFLGHFILALVRAYGGGFLGALASRRRVSSSTVSQHAGETPALPGMLAEIRETILKLKLPDGLRADIERVMQTEGLVAQASRLFVSGDGSGGEQNETNRRDACATTRIKQVWASKWNERAYFSRLARGFPHDAVQMAVLIQEVIPAEYAFVLHTVNPLNGNRDELYAEVVRGLGETLVGNYPGRAMSLVCAKKNQSATVLAYPGKSVGLFGSGLIFRSDSNAEDLEGYAGAGLYDSVLLQPPREEVLDYTGDKLVWDENVRGEFVQKLSQVGAAIEAALGGPQDIEGAFVGGKFFVVQSRPQVGLGE